MTAKTKIAFKTTLRRFPVGADVEPSDDLSPLEYDNLVKRGFIVTGDEAAALEKALKVLPELEAARAPRKHPSR